VRLLLVYTKLETGASHFRAGTVKLRSQHRNIWRVSLVRVESCGPFASQFQVRFLCESLKLVFCLLSCQKVYSRQKTSRDSY
jgi:hypothetical protein